MARYFIAAFLGVATLASAQPGVGLYDDLPKVVRTFPGDMDVGIDPTLTSIRVEFDTPMKPGSHSYCGGGETMPRVAGEPVWESDRVVVLPVKLEPSHEYRVGINCPSTSGFRSAKGKVCTPYTIRYRTGATPGDSRPLLSCEEALGALRTLEEALRNQYSYVKEHAPKGSPEFADIEASITGPVGTSDLARRIARRLGERGDVHLSVLCDGYVTPTAFRQNLGPNWNDRYIEAKVADLKRLPSGIASGRVGEKIGYIWIPSWVCEGGTGPEDAVKPIEQIVAGFKDCIGVVVDVRANGGGDELFAKRAASLFATKEAVYSKNQYRDAASSSGWSEVYERRVGPREGGALFVGPVAVLIGRDCLSSNESFVLMMRHGASAKLFGSRTGGSSGNPKACEIAPGLSVLIPTWRDLQPDGKSIENAGIDPDVKVDWARRTTRTDPVLDEAVKWIQGSVR